QWQSSPVGTNTWTAIAGATTAAATFTHPSGGRDYRCVVTCTSSTQSSNSSVITIQSLNCAPPLNDEACDAMTLVLDGPKDCQNSFYATNNSTDPSFTCSTPNNTIWYKYTPATTGVVQITFKTPDTLALFGWLGVYTASGSCPGGMTFTDVTSTTLGGCKSFGNDTVTKISATLDAGIEYYFMVDGVGGATGNYCISIQTPPPAPATCATNVSPADAAVDVAAPSVYVKWSPVANATSYDVYFGTTTPPTTLKGTTSIDSFMVTGLAYTTTYYWYVVPKNLGGSPTGCDANTTSFTTMATPPPPNNDECDSAINIIAGATVTGSTVSATQSMAAQTCSAFTGTADDDVWYMFTATQSGDVDIKSVPLGTSFDAVVVAYSGTCGSLTQIGCADTSFGGGTEIVHLTGLNAGETYYFRIYSYGSSATGQGGFSVSVAGSALLPVSITKFIGEKKGTSNLLTWTTATEQNNKGFELQRSYNGNDFLKVNFIETKATNGNSATVLNYQFIDAKPFAGITYYRLKQIDLNGKTTLSNVVAIKGDKVTNLTLTDVYPNPTAKLLNVVISSPVDNKVNIVVTDITGKVVKTQAAQITVGNNNSQIDVSNLATGTYLMKVMCSNGCTSTTTKFVKQ
ncbi:MAG: T9SS type A sorting domain-containing protein, partial [Bacteroidetes bacterium]|nr:T9SS type A sorting domain-containing protein [Bacteroidota bacterium]